MCESRLLTLGEIKFHLKTLEMSDLLNDKVSALAITQLLADNFYQLMYQKAQAEIADLRKALALSDRKDASNREQLRRNSVMISDLMAQIVNQ